MFIYFLTSLVDSSTSLEVYGRIIELFWWCERLLAIFQWNASRQTAHAPESLFLLFCFFVDCAWSNKFQSLLSLKPRQDARHSWLAYVSASCRRPDIPRTSEEWKQRFFVAQECWKVLQRKAGHDRFEGDSIPELCTQPQPCGRPDR